MTTSKKDDTEEKQWNRLGQKAKQTSRENKPEGTGERKKTKDIEKG